MVASLEWLCLCRCVALIRVHPEGDFGSPWQLRIILSRIPGEPDQALLSGANRSPTLSEFRAIRAAICEAEFTGAQWDRRSALARRVKFPC
jgi:hypothetical protein